VREELDVREAAVERASAGGESKDHVLALVAELVHELRDPLTPLKGYVLALTEGTIEDTPAAREEYFESMLRQVAKLERLTNLLERAVKLGAPEQPVLILEDPLSPVVAVETLSQTARVSNANGEAGHGEVEGIEGTRGHG
jgi:signal transduction histidine kinase